MSYEFYITPEEYERAKENGVSAKTLDSRIRCLAWEKERAINTPPRRKRNLGEWGKIAEQNGICYHTFYYRYHQLEWDAERAATQGLQDKQAAAEHARSKRRVYPEEILELANQNGINYVTFRHRIRYGWTMEDAATRTTMTHSEAGLRGKIRKLEISRGGERYAKNKQIRT